MKGISKWTTDIWDKTFSQYHRMAWVEKHHNDHRVSTPLLCAGSPVTRPGCPEPYPDWPWMPPGMGHPQPPWATCSSVITLCVKNFLLISNLNLSYLSLKPFPLVLSLSDHVKSHSLFQLISSLRVLESCNEVSPQPSLKYEYNAGVVRMRSQFHLAYRAYSYI